MKLRPISGWLFTLWALMPVGASAVESVVLTGLEQRVQQFVVAFNEQSVDRMLAMVVDDVELLTVNADKVTADAVGREALQKYLASHFKSVPTARSSLNWAHATPSRVAAMESASWQSKAGPRSQSSLSVYEFRGELIQRVYYFPAERAPARTAASP